MSIDAFDLQDLFSTLGILVICLVISVAMVATMVFSKDSMDKSDNPNKGSFSSRLYAAMFAPTKGEVDPEISMQEAINRLSVSLSEHSESIFLLKTLRKRLKKGKKIVMEAMNLGLLKYVLSCIKSMNADDERLPIALDVINEMFNVDEAKEYICKQESPDEWKFIIDCIVLLTKESISKSNLESQPDIVEVNSDDNLESLNQADRNMLNPSSLNFMKSMYKAVMTLGLIASHNNVLQSLVADRGGLDVVIACLKLSVDNRVVSMMALATNINNLDDKTSMYLKEFRTSSVSMAKWCCWCIIHLIFNNPTNKREFLVKQSQPWVLRSLQSCMELSGDGQNSTNSNNSTTNINVIDDKQCRELFQQALSLIFCVVSADPRAKINLYHVRSQLLACGISEVLAFANKRFASHNDIKATVKTIQEALISDWS